MSDAINRVQGNHLMLRLLLQNLHILHTGSFSDQLPSTVYTPEPQLDESQGGLDSSPLLPATPSLSSRLTARPGSSSWPPPPPDWSRSGDGVREEMKM